MSREADYLAQAQSLLPPGDALTREPDATLTRLLSAFAALFHRIDEDATNIAKEACPLHAVHLLPQWERLCGLPLVRGPEIESLRTVDERRTALLLHLTANQTPTADYFKTVAKRLGYTVTLQEPKDTLHTMSVVLDARHGKRVQLFRTGVSRCGDRLGAIRYAKELESLFDHIKPAHVVFLYSYQ